MWYHRAEAAYRWVEHLSACDAQARHHARSLILVAHPDDESVGIGGRLHRLGEVWIAYLTTGVSTAAKPEAREQQALQRRHELQAALKIAQVPTSRAIGLSTVGEHEAPSQLVYLVTQLEMLLEGLEPDVVVTHPYEGGHADHDAAAFIARAVLLRLRRRQHSCPALLEMASYHDSSGQLQSGSFATGPGGRGKAALLTAPEQERKCAMLDCFSSRSQALENVTREFERFRAAPPVSFRQLPHPTPPRRERAAPPLHGERFRSLATDAARTLEVAEFLL